MVYTALTVTIGASTKKMKHNRIVSAQEIVKTHHISYQAVNYYTDLGLLPVLLKKGNARCYDRGLVNKRLKEIRRLAREGYSLRLIRKKLIGI